MNFIYRMRGKIKKDIRHTHDKIVNKPWDDMNYFDSKRNIQGLRLAVAQLQMRVTFVLDDIQYV